MALWRFSFTLFLGLILPLNAHVHPKANKIIVPKAVKFADVSLRFSPLVQRGIQSKVNNLTIFNPYFSLLVARIHLLFPMIEQILAQEQVPDDFKYQALHESMLVGRALSTTNDVGYWQIQKKTALGLHLVINHEIDERMHLSKSTQAAARFLKDQKKYFNSWMGAMLAYYRGRYGAAKRCFKKYYGAKSLYLDAKTDDYIIYVVANKIAFQKIVNTYPRPDFKIHMYHQGYHGYSLQDLAAHLRIEHRVLQQHNHWLLAPKVPHSTSCPLLVPLPRNQRYLKRRLNLPAKRRLSKPDLTLSQPQKKNRVTYLKDKKQILPKVIFLNDLRSDRLAKINGKLAIVAQVGDTMKSLADIVGCPLRQFIDFNESKPTDVPISGITYYYEPKNQRAMSHYHVVQPNENLWSIAQTYGTKLSALLEKNRMRVSTSIQVGQVLWLRFIRPPDVPVAYQQ